MKVAQTGILWSQVQVLVGPPEKQKPLYGVALTEEFRHRQIQFNTEIHRLRGEIFFYKDSSKN